MKYYRLLILLMWCGCTQLHAQLPQSALDYMLQKPRVSKRFGNKHFGDHLFMEGGAGISSVLGSESGYTVNRPGAQVHIQIGDWMTPEHGWRIGLQGGRHRQDGKTPYFAGISLDYLLNITALSTSHYKNIHPFEVYGIAGIEYQYSRYDGTGRNAAGAHLGLRGQLRLSNYTYIYIEPQAGLYSDNMVHEDTWKGYVPMAKLTAGVGYRLQQGGMRSSMPFDKGDSFLDHTFLSFYGGPGCIVNSSPSTWKHYTGGKAGIGMGKWFNPYSGLRLSLSAATYRQHNHKKMKSVGAGADYLWNMHNTFGGYDPTRRFTLNTVAGVHVDWSQNGEERTPVLGVGGGLQANFRLGGSADFFLEPRIDLYQKDYAHYANTHSQWDAVASLLAGFTFHQETNSRALRLSNKEFQTGSVLDHVFFEAGAGATMILTTSTIGHPTEYARPKVFVAAGKWFNAVSGARLWAEGYQFGTKVRTYKSAGIGIDYLWNLSNTFRGYNPDRRTELIGALGVNGGVRSERKQVYFGGNVSLKGVWHVDKVWGLFLEPQLRLYPDNFCKEMSTPLNLDATASLTAGLQMQMNTYAPTKERSAFGKNDRKNFFAVSIGAASPIQGMRNSDNYGLIGQVYYGKWFTPLSAWRIQAGGLLRKTAGRNYAKVSLGADYLADLSNWAYGYNPERVFNLRALAGVNIGVGYRQKSGKATFVPDVHGGLQFAFRLCPAMELYAEPQLAYQFNDKSGDRLEQALASAVIGLTYNLRQQSEGNRNNSRPDRTQFASVSIGTGVSSETLTGMPSVRRKLTLDLDLSYGKWFGNTSGVQAGLSDICIQTKGKGNKHITSVHADYLLNLLSAATGESTEGKRFQLTGFAGLSLSVGSRYGMRPTWGTGLQAGLQAGVRVTPNTEIYIEPCAHLFSKTLRRHSDHPAEGALKLSVGSKFYF